MDGITDKRVLIIENNGLIGEVVAEAIADAGGWPLGPVLSEAEALDMIAYNPGPPDVAILDVGLDDAAFRMADRLETLGVPYLFAALHVADIPSRFRDRPICPKPYTASTLLATVTTALARAGVPEAALFGPLH